MSRGCSSEFNDFYKKSASRIFEIVITYGLLLAAGAAWRAVIEDITIPIFGFHKKTIKSKILYAILITLFTVLISVNITKPINYD